MTSKLGSIAGRLVALLFIVCGTIGLRAQSNLGSIAGTILDPTGAVVSGASVTAINQQTGSAYKALSSDSGAYRFSVVQLGTYKVEVQALGFKNVTEEGVIVQVNTTSSLDVHLQTGGASETVVVSATAPTVQTESSDLGTVVTARQMLELPLALGGQGDLRAPEAFVFLTPGTTGPGTANSSNGVFQAKLAGGQNFGNEVILDGASAFRPDSGSSFDQTAPSVEALQEFKITTSTLPAAYGQTSGGVESFATKSGTNAYHGTIYDFFQNEDLNANSWFNNLKAAQNPTQGSSFVRSVDRKNDYGITLGGPLQIPRLYNGRDKTFFFFSWEQFRQSRVASILNTVPTVAQRGGDFSALLGAPLTANNAPIINPCNGQPILAGQIFDPFTSRTVNGTQCRDPFPGNKITTPLSNVAKTVLALVPLPNIAAVNDRNNFVYKSTSPLLDTTMTTRVDYNISAKSKLFFSYSSRDNTDRNGFPSFADPLTNSAQQQDFFTHYIRVGHDYIFNPTLLNHLNVGYNRINELDSSGLAGVNDWDKQIGLSGASGPTFPQFNFNSPEGYSSYGLSKYADDVPNSLIVADSIEKQFSKHNVTMGLDWRTYQFSIIDSSHQSPALNFSTNQTAALPNQNNAAGSAYASFLLGQVSSYSLAVRSTQPRFVANYYAGYLQDDYKILPTLVLNLGLRYDVSTPRRAAHGDTSNFDPNALNPGASGVRGALVFAGSGPGRLGGAGYWAHTWKKDVAPRIGFSWAPDMYHGNTVLRGGFGIYYARLDYADFGQSLTDGFTASPSGNSTDGFSTNFGLDNGVPKFTPPPNLSASQLNGTGGSGFGGISYVAPNYGRPAMTENWSLELQQQLAPDLILSMGYVGQHSTHLRSSLAQINNINPGYFKYGNILNQAVTAPSAAGVGFSSPFPEFTTLYGPGTAAQSVRPFPQYQTINSDCCLENLGQSSYDALLVKLERRFHNGLNLLASYTWEKTLTDSDSALPAFASFSSGGSVQNSFNLKGEKSLSYQDIPHTFVVSYIYELPAGKGKKFLNRGVASRIAGDWEVSGVQRYQSGQPVSFACATGVPSFDGCIRYSVDQHQSIINPTKAPAHYDPTVYNVFNGSSFNQSTGTRGVFQDPNFVASQSSTAAGSIPYTFGNLPRVTSEYRTPLYLNEDFSIIKNFSLLENYRFQLKADLLNAFNRHVFARPDTNPQDSSFGTVNSTTDNPRVIQFQGRFTF